jgi:hypothetical protein
VTWTAHLPPAVVGSAGLEEAQLDRQFLHEVVVTCSLSNCQRPLDGLDRGSEISDFRAGGGESVKGSNSSIIADALAFRKTGCILD